MTFKPKDFEMNLMVYIMGFLYFIAGLYHFVNPKMYLRIMPNYLPYHMALIYLSGAAEIVLGLGLFFSKTRSLSAWGVIALLLAIYPANLYMWTNDVKINGSSIPTWGHILRFFAQAGLIYWAYLYTGIYKI